MPRNVTLATYRRDCMFAERVLQTPDPKPLFGGETEDRFPMFPSYFSRTHFVPCAPALFAELIRSELSDRSLRNLKVMRMRIRPKTPCSRHLATHMTFIMAFHETLASRTTRNAGHESDFDTFDGNLKQLDEFKQMMESSTTAKVFFSQHLDYEGRHVLHPIVFQWALPTAPPAGQAPFQTATQPAAT